MEDSYVETKVEALEDNRTKVTVTVDAADIDARIKKTYKDFANKYNFPGFRKGKAPRPIIDNALGAEAVRATVTDDVVNGTYPLAIDDCDLYPIAKPEFDETDLVEAGKPYTFSFTVITAISAFCGRTTVSAFGRTIAPRSIMNAVTLLMAGGVLCLVGACAIAGIEDAPFHQCLFEAVSAFGTVGVSMGLTPTLSAASCVILIVMMYMGRVGVLTLGVAVFMRRREPPRLKYPDADVFIG